MKIITILGTRPEIIRLNIIIKKLDNICDHILVDTGQNFDESLSDIFFKDLNIRQPDYAMGINTASFGEQVGRMISEIEKILIDEMPDRLLILGDTNSGLCSIPAKRLGIQVFHMEAGNRCYDDRVPEEVNRRIIDHSSDILMPYTYRSKENLVREGIERERIFVTGNPINEVLNHFSENIIKSNVLNELNLKEKKYFLATMHRAENVDLESRLRNLVGMLMKISEKYKLPIICSLHPRTKSKMEKFGLSFDHKYIKYLDPIGFFNFVALEKNALCVLSDSGTVQEECCIFRVPSITLRDVTERPETIECGSNLLVGDSVERALETVNLVLKQTCNWLPPNEYLEKNISDKVLKILMSFHKF